MKRLALFAALATAASLAACDGPAGLKTAKQGECFEVTGRDSVGAPQLKRTQCAGLAQPEAASAGDGAASSGAMASADDATATKTMGGVYQAGLDNLKKMMEGGSK